MMLRVQRGVEQLGQVIQGGGHDGQVFPGGVVWWLMAGWKSLGEENKTPERRWVGCWGCWWIPGPGLPEAAPAQTEVMLPQLGWHCCAAKWGCLRKIKWGGELKLALACLPCDRQATGSSWMAMESPSDSVPLLILAGSISKAAAFPAPTRSLQFEPCNLQHAPCILHLATTSIFVLYLDSRSDLGARFPRRARQPKTSVSLFSQFTSVEAPKAARRTWPTEQPLAAPRPSPCARRCDWPLAGERLLSTPTPPNTPVGTNQ